MCSWIEAPVLLAQRATRKCRDSKLLHGKIKIRLAKSIPLLAPLMINMNRKQARTASKPRYEGMKCGRSINVSRRIYVRNRRMTIRQSSVARVPIPRIATKSRSLTVVFSRYSTVFATPRRSSPSHSVTRNVRTCLDAFDLAAGVRALSANSPRRRQFRTALTYIGSVPAMRLDPLGIDLSLFVPFH